MAEPTTRLLIRLPDALARRSKRQVAVRHRSKFIERLLEEALPAEEVADDDPLYQAALAVEKDDQLRSEMTEWERKLTTPTVADIAIGAISPEGKSFMIELEVGTPHQCETGEWACPIALRGLHARLAEARGGDSFQALCMAISLAQDLLQGFRQKGGKLLMEAEDFPLEAYAFGAAVRQRL